MNLSEWQREFFAGPKVWVTFYREDGGDEISNLYESEDAAKEQVEFDKRQGRKGRRVAIVRPMHVHTLKLSRDRWAPERTGGEGAA